MGQSKVVFFFQAEDGIRGRTVTGVQTCALPISARISRAREILAALERDELTRGGRPSVSGTPSDPQRQLGLFQSADDAKDTRLREKIAALDVDHMTPIEALTLLAELKKEL